MSARRLGCDAGWEPDAFGSDCVIPRAAHLVLGVVWVALGSWYLCSEVFLFAADVDRFVGFDTLKKMILSIRFVWAVGCMLIFVPYWVRGSDYDDVDWYAKAGGILGGSGLVWIILVVYRSLLRGISGALALNPKVNRWIGNIKGVAAVHCLLFVTTFTLLVDGVMFKRSDSARQRLLCLAGFGVLVPCILAFCWALHLTMATLRTIPDTNQSMVIRKSLHIFKRANTENIVSYSICLLLLLPVITLHEYLSVMCAVTFGVALLPSALSNFFKCRARCHGQPRKQSIKQSTALQILPVSAAKPLAQWETIGQSKYNTSSQEKTTDIVWGVSLAMLTQLAQEKDIPSDWSMAQVCEEVVKPPTKWPLAAKQQNCSYAALIGNATDAEGRQYVEPATQFVSYAWQYSWRIVYSALESFEQRQAEAGVLEPSYFFIDQFCIDQHRMSATTHDQDDDKYKAIVAELQKSIADRSVLMLLHPWSNPIVLSRAWCLFEIYTAIRTESQVQMCFAPTDEALFFEALRNGEFDAKAVCSTVDAMQATATVEDDRTMIMDRINADLGMVRYNSQLRKFLEWQFKLVAMAADQGRSGRRSSAINNASSVDSRPSRSLHHRELSSGGPTHQQGTEDNDGFAELLKHMRRLNGRLEAIESRQRGVAADVLALKAANAAPGPGRQPLG